MYVVSVSSYRQMAYVQPNRMHRLHGEIVISGEVSLPSLLPVASFSQNTSPDIDHELLTLCLRGRDAFTSTFLRRKYSYSRS